jgi:creatinine amidohydrolase
MQWEHLTSLNFKEAVETCEGVGIVPVGVIEPHSAHLPLGTDMLVAHFTACRAAEREPALVFPAYPYGINHESAHLPGSVVFRRDLVFSIMENVCDEMARHGLTKIILFSGHGGNRYFLPLFVQTLMEKEKPYTVYYGAPRSAREALDVLETDEYGHAGELETSTVLYICGELVKMGQVPSQPFTSLARSQALQDVGVYSPTDWYAMYPAMYVGDASKATADKGKVLVDAGIDALVELIAQVKADDVTGALQAEFQRLVRHPEIPEAWARDE